ncbi:MAG: acetolactate decarboxylase [Acidimicrobiia bacterium]
MTRDVLDDRLIGALHVRALSRAGLHHDPAASHAVVQAGTVAALIDGRYDGDLQLRELLERGDLGIGTVQHLDGELIVVDGAAWVAHGDGTVSAVAPSTRTPFAVVCRFTPDVEHALAGPLDFAALTDSLSALTPRHEPVVAVRVDGEFRDLRLRSVHAQQPPYVPLREVVAHQREWTIEHARGSVVGFRFPDATSGIEVAGYHLHFLSDDRTAGGHILDLQVIDAIARVDGAHELAVEVPAGLTLGVPGALGDEIAAVEGPTSA